MSKLLHQLARCGELSWLSYYFAGFIARQARVDIDDMLGVSAALVCEASQNGSVCIDLEHYQGLPLFPGAPSETIRTPVGGECGHWRQQLLSSPCVGAPGASAPLTLDGNRLYLNRFWYYETAVADRILSMLGDEDMPAPAQVPFSDTEPLDQDQRAALQTVAGKRFSVISGGPGSGKTSTVIRILALLIAQNPALRVSLAAPTGKAAARMMDSIRGRIDRIDIDPEALHAIPTEAGTIHRLLGYRRHDFSYHKNRPLAVDCVVIDEASMIDLKLMFHLLDALPRHARVILLGDRDQLASVAAGNVLGDITGHGHDIGASDAASADAIALLSNSYRFAPGSAIGEFASLVNRGDSRGARDMLENAGPGIRWYPGATDRVDPAVLSWILDAYQPIFDSDRALDALDAYESTRVLCATNQGPLGVAALNEIISSGLLARNNRPDAGLYSGLPIMILRNHHELGLYNGDSGILWQQENGLQACFRDADGGIRNLALNRLPEYIPAWASTVHKSQGSEFDTVLLLLPAEDSDALSRELLYTAITRARQRFVLHAGSAAVECAVERVTRRHSGLAQRLGWPA